MAVMEETAQHRTGSTTTMADVDDVRETLKIMRRQELSHRRRHGVVYGDTGEEQQSTASSTMDPSSSHRQQQQQQQHTPQEKCQPATATTSQCNSPEQQQLQQNHHDCRALLLNWMYKIVEHCNYDDCVVGLAIELWDTAIPPPQPLSSSSSSNVLALYPHLVAATCLQLSLKVLETSEIDVNKLVQLGRGAFTAQDVGRMEMILLRKLQWRMTVPSMYCYVGEYLGKLLPSSATEHQRQHCFDLIEHVLQVATTIHKSSSAPSTNEEWALACIQYVFFARPQDNVSILTAQQKQAWALRMHWCGLEKKNDGPLAEKLRSALEKDTTRYAAFQEEISKKQHSIDAMHILPYGMPAAMMHGAFAMGKSPRHVILQKYDLA
eukprot:CAMPEP_0119550146 /NCGR_PEP_ID=MMETSP1352-20130426/3718_1 /TAXON_ID=265584 /ORGANISM="Stauroneis constricta, Strain CCMP1120" /LENGTH=378 /DNA_ID=CAMNT_0007595903 /DNA_START=35 /DNA_END=1171 /DNA_ORIENTATION=+